MLPFHSHSTGSDKSKPRTVSVKFVLLKMFIACISLWEDAYRNDFIYEGFWRQLSQNSFFLRRTYTHEYSKNEN